MGFLFKVLPSHHIFIRNFFIRCYPRTYHLDNCIIYSIFLIVNSLMTHFSLFFCVTYNIIRKNSNFSLSFLIKTLFVVFSLEDLKFSIFTALLPLRIYYTLYCCQSAFFTLIMYFRSQMIISIKSKEVRKKTFRTS